MYKNVDMMYVIAVIYSVSILAFYLFPLSPLVDMFPSPLARKVLMVVGAGRGPLVRASLQVHIPSEFVYRSL